MCMALTMFTKADRCGTFIVGYLVWDFTGGSSFGRVASTDARPHRWRRGPAAAIRASGAA
jgi:hypothetical protein